MRKKRDSSHRILDLLTELCHVSEHAKDVSGDRRLTPLSRTPGIFILCFGTQKTLLENGGPGKITGGGTVKRTGGKLRGTWREKRRGVGHQVEDGTIGPEPRWETILRMSR